MRILITGATGYLGSTLVSAARAAGHDVVAAGHAQSADLQLDVRDASAVDAAIQGVAPEAIIHTAYVQDGPDAWMVNVEGSRNVARAAGVRRLIHLSSDLVFDGLLHRAYVEEDMPRPVTAYGATKTAAEHEVAAAHPGALLVRTSLIYGGATLSKHEQAPLAAVEGETDSAFFTDELRTPVQAGDLAAALLELAQTDVAGPLHVAGADVVSRYEFAALVVRRHGRDPERLRGVTTTELGLVRPLRCALDSSRARALLRTDLRGVRTVLG